MRGALKRRRRDGVYYASNVQWDPVKRVATSYGWWEFVKPIGGKLVFNDYGYSVSTRRHQAKVRRHIEGTFTKVDAYIEAPRGLQDLAASERHYVQKILEVEAAIAKKGSRKTTNEVRRQHLERLREDLAIVQTLMKAEAQ